MDALWFYAVGNERKGPVAEERLLELRRTGGLTDTDLVWKEGMADWVPFGASPLAAVIQPAAPAAEPVRPATPPPPPPPSFLPPVPAAAPGGAPASAQSISLAPMPDGIPGWMKFNGVMLIIQGAMYCLNCIGAIIGVPLIIAGVALFGGADTLEQAGGVSHGMLPFLQKFKSFNTALGVYHIIMMVMLVLSIMLIIAFFGVFAAMLDQALKAAGGMP